MTSVGLPAHGIEIVHGRVPGRLRVRVSPLKRSEPLKLLLERQMGSLPYMHDVRASTVTGTVLLRFEPNVSADVVLVLLRSLLAGREIAISSRSIAWHRLAPEVVLRRLQSTPKGLTAQAARKRLRRFGHNVSPRIGRRSTLELARGQFDSLPVLLLMGAAALSVASGMIADAFIILAVVIANALIGFATELKAERTIRSLSLGREPLAIVLRDGVLQEIPAEGLVPGDVVRLQLGSQVPADARLLTAQDLTLNEALLTGESLPADKRVTQEQAARSRASLLGDRSTMVHRGTIVTGGSATAVVVGTGSNTEFGRIQAMVGRAGPPTTPAQKQLNGLGRQLVLLSGAASLLMLAIGVGRGLGWRPLLARAAALAVAAVPEGLPALATTSLAFGVEDMRRRNILVRHLGALEVLAHVGVVVFDKTGTLTENRMRVAMAALEGDRIAADLARDPSLEPLLEIAVLCNDAEKGKGENQADWVGSPTETALLAFAEEHGIEVADLRRRLPRIEARYRTEGRAFMATFHDDGARRCVMAIKGAPEAVLSLCAWRSGADGRRPLRERDREQILLQNGLLSEKGLRVLGFARREQDGGFRELVPADLTWLGLLGLADGPRAGAERLLGPLQHAGIRALMVTGDQSRTAVSLAGRIGWPNGPRAVVDRSVQPIPADPNELQRVTIFARVSPADKLAIVRALQQQDEVVAMVGDGVNDSPALKAADLGIAVGGDLEPVRGIADIVLAQEDPQLLLEAIRRGRGTYENLRRAIRYLLSTNASEVALTLAATAGVGQPLTPAQLLWINLLSDVLPAIGLALEKPDDAIMDGPPRPADEQIVSAADAKRLSREALVLTIGPAATASLATLLGSPNPGGTGFCGVIASQLLHALSARSDRPIGPSAWPGRPLAIALGLGIAAQAAAFAVPGLRGKLGLQGMRLLDLLLAIAGGLGTLGANEMMKGSDVRGHTRTAISTRSSAFSRIIPMSFRPSLPANPPPSSTVRR